MDKSTAFAIATQQSHVLRKSPRGYGTTEGRQVARMKYPSTKGWERTADKTAAVMRAYFNEFQKLAGMPSLPDPKPEVQLGGMSTSVPGTGTLRASVKPGSFRSGAKNNAVPSPGMSGLDTPTKLTAPPAVK